MRRPALPIGLKDVSERNLADVIGELHGYLKFTSMAWIRALRQPILDGLILKEWSAEAERAMAAFCVRHRCDEVLLRIDALNERWSRRRGGYLIPASRAQAVVRELHGERRIAAFLEPVSPYRDRYSLAAITDETQEEMTVEVVGPGFDASDLLRSDTQPHERFEVVVPRFSRNLEARQAIHARRTYSMRPQEYRRTVDARLRKIGARLKNPAHPEVVLNSGANRRADLVQKATDFLRGSGQTALLSHVDYEPIPRDLLERFAIGVGNLISGLGRYKIRLGATSFSGSFTTRGRLIFWDFFPARLESAKPLYLNR